MDSPIVRYRRFLESRGWWDPEQDKQWIGSVGGGRGRGHQKKHVRGQMKGQVMEAFARAEKVKKRPPEELFEDVYAELPKSLQRQKDELSGHLDEYGANYPQLEHFEKFSD
jgi:2-oxoisovalerate dehydrogenase E1 component alpha subunit